jgi:ATP-dependent helicase/nuclease subunit A
MTLPPLTVISAGAGSGKTYAIQKRLGHWVKKRLVAPERIVAVTFTEAAAAELRDRLRGELVNANQVKDALLLDQAYISTIHGFGHRLLSEFSFEAGMAPHLRLVDPAEEKMLVRQALSGSAEAEMVATDLGRLGYRFEWGSGRSAEDAFRARVLDVIGKLRVIGRGADGGSLAKSGVKWLKKIYGSTGDGDNLTAILHRAIRHLQMEFPDDISAIYGTNDTARNQLFRDRQTFIRAQEADNLDRDWALWQRLRDLRQSKRGSSLPDEYDTLTTAIMEAAAALPSHPGPLTDAQAHVRTLFQVAAQVIGRYDETKRAAGLVDYSDMIAQAFDLLRCRHDVLDSLRSQVDCLAIDEFQDTNPLQFSLLWLLQAAGVPTLVVGDLKQAIMGFQNADPRLMEALCAREAEAAETLDLNWRTQPKLMPFVNALGVGLFGDAYTTLKPRAKAGFQDPLEVIDFPAKPYKAIKWQEVRAAHTARRLKDLLEDDTQRVRDRRAGEARRLRGGDIAILCPTNDLLDKYSDALRAFGLRPRIRQAGWHESRIVQLVRQAIAFVADPGDRHAALYLAATELGVHGLRDAVAKLIDDGRIDDPVLDALAPVADGPADQTVTTLVDGIIDALGLFGRIAEWPDAAQVRADLIRLQAEAEAFVAADPETLAAGGFHGSDPRVFLAWLVARAEADRDSNRHPEARVRDEDAIELSTWHRAKGREWPVVAVCGWERKVEPRLPDLSVHYERFGDLEAILEKARLHFSPSFDAEETRDRFIATLQHATQAESRRLIYVAVTRARERLIIEWPSHLERKPPKNPKPTLFGMLRNTGLSLTEKGLEIGGSVFPCRIGKASDEFPADYNPNAGEVTKALPAIGRRAILRQVPPADLTHETLPPTASERIATTAPEALETTAYGDPLDTDLAVRGTARGDLLHRAFEILGADPGKAGLLARATGIGLTGDQIEAIATAVRAFDVWITDRFKPIALQREMPFLYLDPAGSVVPGTIDLLVETTNGLWIVDHKSDRITDVDAQFRHHWPQLAAYVEAVAALRHDKPLHGVAINWITFGVVTAATTTSPET